MKIGWKLDGIRRGHHPDLQSDLTCKILAKLQISGLRFCLGTRRSLIRLSLSQDISKSYCHKIVYREC